MSQTSRPASRQRAEAVASKETGTEKKRAPRDPLGTAWRSISCSLSARWRTLHGRPRPQDKTVSLVAEARLEARPLEAQQVLVEGEAGEGGVDKGGPLLRVAAGTVRGVEALHLALEDRGEPASLTQALRRAGSQGCRRWRRRGRNRGSRPPHPRAPWQRRARAGGGTASWPRGGRGEGGGSEAVPLRFVGQRGWEGRREVRLMTNPAVKGFTGGRRPRRGPPGHR